MAHVLTEALSESLSLSRSRSLSLSLSRSLSLSLSLSRPCRALSSASLLDLSAASSRFLANFEEANGVKYRSVREQEL